MMRAAIALALVGFSVQGSGFNVRVRGPGSGFSRVTLVRDAPENVNANANANENHNQNQNQNQNPERRTLNPEPVVVRVGFAKPGGGYAVVEMPLETYVARVVAGEAARDSRPAALEALAITVRTFARANRTRHRADGFDLCDQTHCQVVRAATAATAHAAAATDRPPLPHRGMPATVYDRESSGA